MTPQEQQTPTPDQIRVMQSVIDCIAKNKRFSFFVETKSLKLIHPEFKEVDSLIEKGILKIKSEREK